MKIDEETQAWLLLFRRTGMFSTRPGSLAEGFSRRLEKHGLVKRHDVPRVPGGSDLDYWSYTDAGWDLAKAAQSEGKDA